MMYRWAVLAGMVAGAGCGPGASRLDTPPGPAWAEDISLVSLWAEPSGDPGYAHVSGVVRNASARPLDVLLEVRVLGDDGAVVGGRRECTGEVPARGEMPFKKAVLVEPGSAAFRPAVRVIDARPWD